MPPSCPYIPGSFSEDFHLRLLPRLDQSQNRLTAVLAARVQLGARRQAALGADVGGVAVPAVRRVQSGGRHRRWARAVGGEGDGLACGDGSTGQRGGGHRSACGGGGRRSACSGGGGGGGGAQVAIWLVRWLILNTEQHELPKYCCR